MTLYMFTHYVILMMILHSVQMTAKTETIGAGVEKVKISANLDNLITKIFLVI